MHFFDFFAFRRQEFGKTRFRTILLAISQAALAKPKVSHDTLCKILATNARSLCSSSPSNSESVSSGSFSFFLGLAHLASVSVSLASVLVNLASRIGSARVGSFWIFRATPLRSHGKEPFERAARGAENLDILLHIQSHTPQISWERTF